MGELSGNVALVTRASRGLGQAIAHALSQAGADVAINYHTQKKAAMSQRKKYKLAPKD